MRIKLSKQNWRLVGQKMGWLKRAQITTNNSYPLDNGAGVGSTGAAEAMEAMGIGPDKITPNALGKDTGNVDEGKMKYNNSPYSNPRNNIRRDQGLLTGVQSEILHEIDSGINNMNYYGSIRIWSAEHNYKENYINASFGSIKDGLRRRSGPVTFESLEEALESWPMPWHTIDEKLDQGRNKLRRTDNELRSINNYTPAQLQLFEKSVAERRQKLESAKGLVRNAFRTYMASKPQIQNTGGLDFTGNVKL